MGWTPALEFDAEACTRMRTHTHTRACRNQIIHTHMNYLSELLMRITFLSSRRELKSFSSEGTDRAENSCVRSRSSSLESWGLRTVKTTLEMGPARKRHAPSSVLVFRFKWRELYLIPNSQITYTRSVQIPDAWAAGNWIVQRGN